jgi:hypothetical protein
MVDFAAAFLRPAAAGFFFAAFLPAADLVARGAFFCCGAAGSVVVTADASFDAAAVSPFADSFFVFLGTVTF